MLTATPHRFALFDTPIGGCALVWGEHGLVGALLPEASASATRARLKRRFAAAVDAPPSAAVQHAIERIVGLLSGGHDDLQDIALDMAAVPPFNRRVYEITRRIEPGHTLTYGEVAARLGEPHAARLGEPHAARLGEPHAARAVGQALGANPFPIIVPCHRVLAAGGQGGGFSAPGGTRTKLRLLEIEGAPLGGTPGLFD